MKTRVVHCKKEDYDIYIGRPSKWGNPFKDGTRKQVIEKYRKYVLSNRELLDNLDELEGKVVCNCFGVTDKEIERVIRENDLTTVDDVTNYCKAGGGCGGCRG